MFKRISFISIVLGLNLLNLLTLYSAVHGPEGAFFASVFIKQIVWIAAGWILAYLVSRLNHRTFFDMSIPVYIIVIFFLLLVVGLGIVQMGARRWINLLGFTFQPSELAKIAGLLIIARTMAARGEGSRLYKEGFFSEIVLPFLPASVIFLLIFVQPDLGTSLVIVFLYAIMLLANKPRFKNVLIAITAILGVIPLGWSLLKPYQKSRVMTFLNPESDPLGAGYTIIQSKIAIGSGKLLGKGFMSGTQNQFNFIPARHTDFIFSVFAEEWGFVGCLVMLALFYILFNLILDTAAKARDKFTYNLCIGIFGLFFIHMFINIAMVMGLLPVVGLPLMFFSYGGSYMLLNFVLVGMFLSVLKEER